MTPNKYADQQAKAKDRRWRRRHALLICNSPARFHVRPGNLVANALTYGKPWGSR